MKKQKQQPIALKKYNKVLSIIIKDYKERGTPYTLKEARQLASITYQTVKQFPPSKITKGKTLKQAKKDEEIKIEATDVPNYWFDNQANFTYYFQVGDWANQFANAYPKIPIMLITKKTEKQPLVVQGAEGDYDGSIFQRWVEDIRDDLPEADYNEIGYFFGTPAYFDGKLYAVWFEDGVKIPEVAPPITDIEPRKKILIDEAEETEKKRREIEKPKKKRGRPKKTEEEKKRPLPKKKGGERKKPIEKPTSNRVTEIRNLIADLRQDLKDGLITKKFYQTEVAKLTSKLEKGGKI